jgi:hypothetical protein
MKKTVALLMVLAMLSSVGLVMAQEKGGGQTPQQPMVGPGMMGQGMMMPPQIMQEMHQTMQKMQEMMAQAR